MLISANFISYGNRIMRIFHSFGRNNGQPMKVLNCGMINAEEYLGLANSIVNRKNHIETENHIL